MTTTIEMLERGSRRRASRRAIASWKTLVRDDRTQHAR